MKKTWMTVNGSLSAQNGEHMADRRLLWQQTLWIGFMALTGILLPRAIVYGGLAPFGVSAAACFDGAFSALACAFSAVGYILPSEVVMPLRYMASLAVVLGIRWALGNVKKISSSVAFEPVLTGVSLMITGLAVDGMQGFQWGVLLAQLCEGMLGAGFAFFYKQALCALKSTHTPASLSLTQQASLMISASAMLMAVDRLMIGDISIGRILTILLILLASKAGQQQGGMLAGVVLGASTALAMPSYALAALSFAFGGLIAGAFSRFGRPITALIFFSVHMLVQLSTGDMVTFVIGAYECFAASLLFLVLPPSVDRAANALFCRSHTDAAVEGLRRSVDMRLQYASGTMRDIATTVDSVSEKLSSMEKPKLKNVYSHVCEHLCNSCRDRERCWKNEFTDTMSVFRRMGFALRSQGRLEMQDVDDSFCRSCRHADEIVQCMNREYARLVTRENAYQRLEDMRSIVTDQFEGMAVLLSEIAEDFVQSERVDEQTGARIEAVCARYRLPVREIVCLVGRRNRMVVEMLLEGDTVPNTDTKFHKDLCRACGCTLDAPTITKNGFFTAVRFTEKPRLQVRFGSAQLNCENEKLCGDAFEQFYDRDGRFCAVLSDGMGSGGRAAVDGAMTAALAGRLLQAGFCYNNTLRIINSSLIVKSKEESLSTLDVVQIDLFSGYLQGLKAGAPPAFLYSRGRVCKITSSSLPIGILRQVDAHTFNEYVDKGDVLVMVSDGVADDDTTWLEELIVHLAQQETSEKAIASEIVFRARERQKDHTDDTTALVLRIA